MAKSSSGLFTVLVVAGAVLTGTAASAKVHVHKAAYQPKSVFMCSTCKVKADKDNKCPMCKVAFNKDGSCPKCGGHLIRKRV
ncbi:MAG TPA: hypothetical protein V6D05_10165 [Stenomitos sp.]